MNIVDTLYYFKSKETIENIISEGFKPSFANEKFGDRSVLIPMVSFSNVLLRDIGHDQVLSYGEFGIGFPRSWAIRNNINPVIYSFNEGDADKAIKAYFDNSVFVSCMDFFKEQFKETSENKLGPFSKKLALTNTSKESMAIIDFLSVHYNEELVEILSRYGRANLEHTKALIHLAKPYQVENNAGKKFIAYNDREWRKTYPQIDFILDTGKSYQETKDRKKPHIVDEKYRLNFELNDISIVVVENEKNIDELKQCLDVKFGKNEVDKRLLTQNLKINTKKKLIEQGF